MAQSESFFKRLNRLFRSGPSIQRRVKGYDSKNYYDSKLVQGNYGYRAPAPFGFGRENSPFSVLGSYGILDRMARYAEFAEMEYCVHGDTKIAVPGGYKTIKELAVAFLNQKKVASEKTKWQLLNIAFPLVLLGIFGFLFNYFRKKRYSK